MYRRRSSIRILFSHAICVIPFLQKHLKIEKTITGKECEIVNSTIEDSMIWMVPIFPNLSFSTQ